MQPTTADRSRPGYWSNLVSADQQGVFHRSSGHVPIQVASELAPGLDAFWGEQPVFRRAYDALDEAPAGVVEPSAYGGRVGPYHAVDAVVNRGLADARAGDSTIDDAFAEVVAESEEIIAAYESRR